MTTEQFANLAQTNLNGSIASGATSLVVASATGFPTTGNFRILIDNELFLVTAVSGNTFTVTPGAEGTAQAAHTTGVPVTCVLTAGALAAAYPPITTGTWTPSVGGTATYTLQSGTYTKIGNIVFITGSIQINSIGTGSTGVITGLPFTAANLSPGSVGYFSASATNPVFLSCYAYSTYIDITGLTTAATNIIDPFIFFQDGAFIHFSIAYSV